MKFSIKEFFSKCDQKFPAILVTFTKEILNGKLHFLCTGFCLFNFDSRANIVIRYKFDQVTLCYIFSIESLNLNIDFTSFQFLAKFNSVMDIFYDLLILKMLFLLYIKWQVFFIYTRHFLDLVLLYFI